jgi:hypothetical protein
MLLLADADHADSNVGVRLEVDDETGTGRKYNVILSARYGFGMQASRWAWQTSDVIGLAPVSKVEPRHRA